MSLSDLIAGLALVVSAWSLYLSKKSLDQSQAAQASHAARDVEVTKAELLALLSDCKAVLNVARVDIGALKAVFDAEPPEVRALLQNFVGLFTQYLPRIESAMTDVETDWRAVNGWSGDFAVSDLMREKSRIYEDLRSFEFAASQATELVAEFKDKLISARKVVIYRRAGSAPN